MEVNIGDEDGYVCGEGFDNDAATVICVALGYDGGHVASDDEVDEFDSADDEVDILLKDVDCDGHEDNFGNCDASEFDSDEHDCDYLAAVVCGNTYYKHATLHYHIFISTS